jgi:hypothetical protein
MDGLQDQAEKSPDCISSDGRAIVFRFIQNVPGFIACPRLFGQRSIFDEITSPDQFRQIRSTFLIRYSK